MLTPIAIVLLTAGALGSSASFVSNESGSAKPEPTVAVSAPAAARHSEQSVFLAGSDR